MSTQGTWFNVGSGDTVGWRELSLVADFSIDRKSVVDMLGEKCVAEAETKTEVHFEEEGLTWVSEAEVQRNLWRYNNYSTLCESELTPSQVSPIDPLWLLSVEVYKKPGRQDELVFHWQDMTLGASGPNTQSAVRKLLCGEYRVMPTNKWRKFYTKQIKGFDLARIRQIVD